MTLSRNNKAVLANMVIDPDAWYAHAVNYFGQEKADEHLAAKVARGKPEYDAAKAENGYKTRAVRQAADDLAMDGG